MIDIRNVSHQIDGTPILHNIHLTFDRPGIVALVGPNGAGKSTLFSLMARLQPLQQGEILVDGLNVRYSPARDIARRLAILTQDNTIQQRLTVYDLLLFGRYPHNQGRVSETDHAVVRTALEQFDLQALAHRYLAALSGGQRQRALIAMVFCQQTPHILLDEPLNNLDMFHARALMQILRRLTDEHGLMTVMVVHDINVAAAYADHIVAMQNGHIAAQGTPAELITRDHLKAIFDIDAEVITHRGMPLVIHHI